MSYTTPNGRLCNQIIRNLCLNFVARKHDLHVISYSSQDRLSLLGINLYSGKRILNHAVNLHDKNYFSILDSESIDFNLLPNDAFFQTTDIIKFLFNHLNNNPLKTDIISHNPFQNNYNKNNNCFVHVRLDDMKDYNPGYTYYHKTLSKLSFNHLYIGSDEYSHDYIKKLRVDFPNSTLLLDYDDVKTIQFGSTCKHVVLSHGSFSAFIGYIAFFSDVYFPEYILDKKKWHGDLFCIKKWNKVLY